jgi:hypothetical protein
MQPSLPAVLNPMLQAAAATMLPHDPLLLLLLLLCCCQGCGRTMLTWLMPCAALNLCTSCS